MLSLRRVVSIATTLMLLFAGDASAHESNLKNSVSTKQILHQTHQLALDLYRVQAQINQLKVTDQEIKQAQAKKDAKQLEPPAAQSTRHAGPMTYRATQAQHDFEPLRKGPKPNIDKMATSRYLDPLLGVSEDVKEKIHQTAINYMNGITVLTSPILGLKSAWTPTDLLYTVPAMNEDLRLLQNKEGFGEVLRSFGGSLNMRPLIVVSGGIEGTVLFSKSYTNSEQGRLSLNTAELDIWPIASHWASGFFSIVFDNSPPETGTRVANSRLFLQRGFLTIGHLDAYPVYMTIGQMFVPFGVYTSAVVTAPLTLSLGRSNERTFLAGYYKDGLYAEAYIFNGNRETRGQRFIMQSGFNIGFKRKNLASNAYDFGAGVISNLADSQGIQNNALDPGGTIRGQSVQFGGFAVTFDSTNNSSDNLKHNVAGLDLHFEWTKGNYSVITEFVTALRSFAPGDLLFANHGATPRALHLEFDYNPVMKSTPMTLGVAFGKTWEALPLNLPEYSLFLVAEASLWKDTQLSVEYRHDINYPYTPNTGGGGNGNRANILPVPGANVGGSRDLVTVLLGVYF